jgi:hypothetical protein
MFIVKPEDSVSLLLYLGRPDDPVSDVYSFRESAGRSGDTRNSRPTYLRAAGALEHMGAPVRAVRWARARTPSASHCLGRERHRQPPSLLPHLISPGHAQTSRAHLFWNPDLLVHPTVHEWDQIARSSGRRRKEQIERERNTMRLATHEVRSRSRIRFGPSESAGGVNTASTAARASKLGIHVLRHSVGMAVSVSSRFFVRKRTHMR